MCPQPRPPERPESVGRLRPSELLSTATRARRARELVDDLLDGDAAAVAPEQMACRARALGHDQGRSCRTIALRWSGQAVDDRFMAAVDAAARALEMVCWSTRRDREARQALRIRSASSEPHGVTGHDELGIYGLVSQREADDYVQEWLAPLLEHDRRNATELRIATRIWRGPGA